MSFSRRSRVFLCGPPPMEPTQPAPPAPRATTDRPAYKLTVELLSTYKQINELFYEAKRKRQAMEKSGGAPPDGYPAHALKYIVWLLMFSDIQHQVKSYFFWLSSFPPNKANAIALLRGNKKTPPNFHTYFFRQFLYIEFPFFFA